MWTHFHDMHSGGGQKLDWGHLFIEAPEDEAKVIFQNRFGRNPDRVTCTCCGPDYSLTQSDTLEQATGYERGCDGAYITPDGKEHTEAEAWVSGKGIVIPGAKFQYVERPSKRQFSWKKYQTLADYIANGKVLIVRADEILDEQRKGELQEEGYVWR